MKHGGWNKRFLSSATNFAAPDTLTLNGNSNLQANMAYRVSGNGIGDRQRGGRGRQHDLRQRSSSANQAWCDDLTMSTVNQSMPTLTWGQTFGFDGFGNLLSETPTAGSAPHLSVGVNTATNQITPGSAVYGANGNLTSNGTTTFSFDLMGRMKTAGSYSYTYSAGENKRIAVYRPNGSGGGMTFYMYGPDGKRLGAYNVSSPNGNWSWSNVTYIGPPQTFQYLGGKALNYSEDRLSSNGNRYYPFGQASSGTGQPAEMPTFGTYVPDSGSGMLYADQRYYDAAWGRFLTPDPSDRNVDYKNPGSWNRYAYTNGDPINGSDPRGEELYDDGIVCWSPVGGGGSDGVEGGGTTWLVGNAATDFWNSIAAETGQGVNDPTLSIGFPSPAAAYGDATNQDPTSSAFNGINAFPSMFNFTPVSGPIISYIPPLWTPSAGDCYNAMLAGDPQIPIDLYYLQPRAGIQAPGDTSGNGGGSAPFSQQVTNAGGGAGQPMTVSYGDTGSAASVMNGLTTLADMSNALGQCVQISQGGDQ